MRSPEFRGYREAVKACLGQQRERLKQRLQNTEAAIETLDNSADLSLHVRGRHSVSLADFINVAANTPSTDTDTSKMQLDTFQQIATALGTAGISEYRRFEVEPEFFSEDSGQEAQEEITPLDITIGEQIKKGTRATVNDRNVVLTDKELKLLLFLSSHQGRFLIVRIAEELDIDPWKLSPAVSSLRNKIEVDPKNPQYLIGISGVGGGVFLRATHIRHQIP